jgi:hypothetical protein
MRRSTYLSADMRALTGNSSGVQLDGEGVGTKKKFKTSPTRELVMTAG